MSTATGSATLAEIRHGIRGALRPVRVDVEDRDVGPEPGEAERDALPDARAGAGDDRDLVGQQDVGGVERGVPRVARDLHGLPLVECHGYLLRRRRRTRTGVKEARYVDFFDAGW